MSPESVVGTTVITKFELLLGRFAHLVKAADGPAIARAQDLLTETENLLAAILLYPFDQKAASEFDRLRNVKGLRKVGRNDLLIASIALACRATVVTRNIRHFRSAPTLRTEN